eukprot:580758-Pyramimonas_sp.AAC.1
MRKHIVAIPPAPVAARPWIPWTNATGTKKTNQKHVVAAVRAAGSWVPTDVPFWLKASAAPAGNRRADVDTLPCKASKRWPPAALSPRQPTCPPKA